MDFKIGMVSKMTGLSPSGIRFLENKGFLRPTQGRKGTYRSYGIEDVVEILNYRNNRACGITEEELLALTDGVSEARFAEILEKHSGELEAEIQEKARLLRHINERNRDMHLIVRRDTFFEVTERPAIIWIPLTSEPGTPFRWPEDLGFEIPYLDSVLQFSENWEVEVGIGLFEYEVQHCGFLTKEKVQYFPRHKAVHCIAEIGPDMCPVEPDRLEAFAEGKPVKRILSKRLLSAVRPVRYDNLWMDIE